MGGRPRELPVLHNGKLRLILQCTVNDDSLAVVRIPSRFLVFTVQLTSVFPFTAAATLEQIHLLDIQRSLGFASSKLLSQNRIWAD